MQRVKGLAHGQQLSPALVVALLALVAALVGPAWANQRSATMSLATTISVVKRTTSIRNNQVVQNEVPCPKGTRVFSGGFTTTGQHVQWIATGPARVGNAYLAFAYMPPANINAGITNQTANITAVALCAKSGRAIIP